MTNGAKCRAVQSGMVDVHCHLLPNVDDGAKSLEMAKEMCEVAHRDGITHIVCTPHANDEFRYDRERYQELMVELQAAIGDLVKLSLGCDFHFSYDNIQAVMSDADQFLIGDGDYLLVELSDFVMSPAVFQSLERLVGMGIRPVITHPERNLMLQRHADRVIHFAEKGCAIQVTANSLTGHWGEGPRKMVNWLLDQKAVHVIATDAHDPKFRPPILSAAREIIAKTRGEDLARALVLENPQAIVDGQPLPWFPTPNSVK